ncbi:hypothetical protein HII31_02597 [Pseudocercospora fuligena]|uniref:Uncharacterized protein n=1 Tax=Pseudocercospora fuligena TaxID=685502 RepID=A0A8H6RS79_9PEZI|nr:hypothetical protein HII31_02597 [Pseudocercospora fuligena]
MVDSLSANMERDFNPHAAKSSRLDEDGVLSTGFENYEGASTDRVSLQLPISGDVLDGRRREYPTLHPFLTLTDPHLEDEQKFRKIMTTMKYCEGLPVPPDHPYIEADLTCGASGCNKSTKVYVSKSLPNTAAHSEEEMRQIESDLVKLANAGFHCDVCCLSERRKTATMALSDPPKKISDQDREACLDRANAHPILSDMPNPRRWDKQTLKSKRKAARRDAKRALGLNQSQNLTPQQEEEATRHLSEEYLNKQRKDYAATRDDIFEEFKKARLQELRKEYNTKLNAIADMTPDWVDKDKETQRGMKLKCEDIEATFQKQETTKLNLEWDKVSPKIADSDAEEPEPNVLLDTDTRPSTSPQYGEGSIDHAVDLSTKGITVKDGTADLDLAATSTNTEVNGQVTAVSSTLDKTKTHVTHLMDQMGMAGKKRAADDLAAAKADDEDEYGRFERLKKRKTGRPE